MIEKMTDEKIEALRAKKIQQCEKAVDLSSRKMEILNRLSTATMDLNEADYKTYRIAIYMPQKRKHDALVSQLVFWSDPAQVRAWLVNSQLITRGYKMETGVSMA